MMRFFLFVLLLAIVLPTASSYAQSPASAGVGISPAVIEFPGDPGQTYEQTFTVSNLTNSNQTYYLFLRDIVRVQSGGVPVFAEDDEEKTGFELSEWVKLETTEIDVPAGGEQVVSMSIAVPEDASPGSHFGGVFVSVEPPRMRTVGAAVGYQVANILSIRVAGDAVIDAGIRQFSTGNFIYGEPTIDFTALVENSGNVLIRPFGPLEITNMFGREVAELAFNQSRAGVFPGSERQFQITWDDEGPGFGRYQADLSLLYGEPGRQMTMSSSITFWVLPMNIILPALGVLAFLLLSVYIGVKLYIRRHLATHATGSRRLVRQQRRSGPSATLLILVVMLSVTALFLLLLLVLFA